MALGLETNVGLGTFTSSNPSELDYLKPNGFKFIVTNIPNVAFFCQGANVPDVGVGVATAFTPLLDYPLPGEKLVYQQLQIRFLIQEDMANYIELYEWLKGIGSPTNTKEYTEYATKRGWQFPGISIESNDRLLSDCVLIILDSNNNPVKKITFIDAFPTSLSALDFDISTGNTDYFVGLASFAFKYYRISDPN